MANSPTPSTPPGEPDWELIARHFAGEATAEESAAVAAWLADHPADAAALRAIDAQATRASAPSVDVEAALRRVHEKMAEGTPVVPLRSVARSTSSWRRSLPFAAAAVLMLAVGVSRLWQGGTPAPRVAITAAGAIDTLVLSDSTQIIVGPGSTLMVAGDYDAGHREVRLAGMAWFAVKHDATHPFTVRAGGALLTDIGTAFAVRTEESGVEVSVREGAVKMQVGAADHGVELAAGDVGRLGATGAVEVSRATSSPDDAAFTRGQLVFREAPVARVQSELKRWYGLQVVVADSTLAGRHLTASFGREPKRQVLDVIAMALGATYEMRGDTITLRPASLTVRPPR